MRATDTLKKAVHAVGAHQVSTHPTDRHVVVTLGGEVLADSRRAIALEETGHRTRYYLPREDVRTELLTPSDTSSHCPYKGEAEYWSARVGGDVHADIAWSYRTPLPESEKIAGLSGFYTERVDLYIDGVLQARPTSRFG